MRSYILGPLLLVGLSFLACATTSRKRSPEQKRTAVLVALMEQHGGQPEHSLRYNPTICPCPPFEVLLGTTWARVALVADTADEKAVVELTERARKEHERSPSKLYQVRGSLDDSSVGVCGPSFPVIDLELLGVVPDGP